jgi:hypothetical protein
MLQNYIEVNIYIIELDLLDLDPMKTYFINKSMCKQSQWI